VAQNPDFPREMSVWVEVGKPNLRHKKGDTWYAECQIELPKKMLRATKTGSEIFSAIDAVKDEMKQLIVGYKEKLEDQRRK